MHGKYLEEKKPQELIKIIFSYISQVAEEKDINKLLLLLSQLGKELITCDRCTIWIVDKKENKIWTKVAMGVDRLEMPCDKGIVGETLNLKKPLIINDPYNHPKFDPEVDRKTGYKTKNIITIPITNTEGNIIAIFQAINKLSAKNSFDEEDLQKLTLATTYIGKELEAAILYDEIINTQKEVIFKMAEIGEMRSKETGNHVKRVAEYSYLTALSYGLSEREAEILKLASPMHDIGKVAIPDSILMKPGKLTDEEMEYMKKHTQFGYEVLRNSEREIIKSAAIVAYQHHEKWDGSGYPQGLKSENIHIFGRITAIADVFDALASDRCYKKAWEMDRVLNLLETEQNKHFDPKVVQAFFKTLPQILEIKEKFTDHFD